MTLRDLPIGTKVREKNSGVVFLVGEHEHAGYKGTTLITDHIIGQACLDAPEINNPSTHIQLSGYNHYAFSNLHQWLNAEDKDWYHPLHTYDAEPSEENIAVRPNSYDSHGYNAYSNKEGFLSWFSESFRNAIYESDIPCINCQQDDIEIIKAKVFLPSTAEAGIRIHDPLMEGNKIAIFNDFRYRYATPSDDAVANSQWQPAYFNTGQLYMYWLRTPKLHEQGFSYYAHTVNPCSVKFCSCAWIGIRPVVNMDSGSMVEKSKNVGGLYLI